MRHMRNEENIALEGGILDRSNRKMRDKEKVHESQWLVTLVKEEFVLNLHNAQKESILLHICSRQVVNSRYVALSTRFWLLFHQR